MGVGPQPDAVHNVMYSEYRNTVLSWLWLEEVSLREKEMALLRESPGYKRLLRSIIQLQIKLLVDQLEKQTGDECIMLVASIPEQTLCILGTSYGEEYLRSKDDLKIDFLRHCLQGFKEGKGVEEKSNRMPRAKCTKTKDTISSIEGKSLLAMGRNKSRSSQASKTKNTNLQTVDNMGKRRLDAVSKTRPESPGDSKQCYEIDHKYPDEKKRRKVSNIKRKGDEGRRWELKSRKNAAIKNIKSGLRSKRNVSIGTARPGVDGTIFGMTWSAEDKHVAAPDKSIELNKLLKVNYGRVGSTREPKTCKSEVREPDNSHVLPVRLDKDTSHLMRVSNRDIGEAEREHFEDGEEENKGDKSVCRAYTTHAEVTHTADEVKVEPPDYDLQQKPPDDTIDKFDDSTEVMEADLDMSSRMGKMETSEGSPSTYVNKDTCAATQSNIDTNACTGYKILNEEASFSTPSTNRNTEGGVGGPSRMDCIEDCVLTTRGGYGNVKKKFYTSQRETDLNGSIIVKASKVFKIDEIMDKAARIGSPDVEIYTRDTRDKCFGITDDQKSNVNVSGTSKSYTKEICTSKRLVETRANVDVNEETRTVVLDNSFDGFTAIDTLDVEGVGNSDSQSGKSCEKDDMVQDGVSSEKEAGENDAEIEEYLSKRDETTDTDGLDEAVKKNISKKGKRRSTPGKALDPNLRTSVILEIISNGGDTKTGKTPLGVYTKVQKKLGVPALSSVTRLWQRFVTDGTLAQKKGD